LLELHYAAECCRGVIFGDGLAAAARCFVRAGVLVLALGFLVALFWGLLNWLAVLAYLWFVLVADWE
jgi:hypothetical protein